MLKIKRMNKILLLVGVLIASLGAVSQEKINWISMQEALDLSNKKGNTKKIFIDAYTDWCGWCKKMDASTFTDPNVIKFMNENYLAVKFDAESYDTITYRGQNSQPKPDKKSRRGTYHYFAAALLDGQLSYPSYIIMDENQNRLAIYKGFMQTEPFLSVIKFFGYEQHQQFSQYLYGEFERTKQASQDKK